MAGIRPLRILSNNWAVRIGITLRNFCPVEMMIYGHISSLRKLCLSKGAELHPQRQYISWRMTHCYLPQIANHTHNNLKWFGNWTRNRACIFCEINPLLKLSSNYAQTLLKLCRYERICQGVVRNIHHEVLEKYMQLFHAHANKTSWIAKNLLWTVPKSRNES